MSEATVKKPSAIDRVRIDGLTDDVIDTTDIPPLGDSFSVRASLRRSRTTVAVAVDSELLAWFQAQGDA